jgi:DNA-binding CsgD family transcriptional regulator
VLVGRDEELSRLGLLLEGARSGTSGVLVVTGEIGIGKSALLDEVEHLAVGMRVLRARGVQSETCVPFGGLYELCRPVLGFLDSIAASQKAALESALALRPAHPGDRFIIGVATLNLLAVAAEAEPLLILIDDAQWVDGSTADALRFSFRRFRADRVAVVVGTRSDEPSLADSTDFPSLHLGGLNRESAQRLVEQHATAPVPAELVDRLHRGTSGNPLALVELAGDSGWFDEAAPLDAPLPIVSRVTRVYTERLRTFPVTTATALLLVACNDNGDVGEFSSAAGRLGVTADDLAPAEAVNLVRVVAGRVEFCHPLARSAVYGEAEPARRRVAHRAIADVLPDVAFDRRAWHLALAALGPDDAVCAGLERAGHHARERSAYDVASRTFERASSFATGDLQKGRLIHAAAESAWLAGMSARAVAFVDLARKHAVDHEVGVAIEELRGYIATRLGDVGEAHRILIEGADMAADSDPDRAVVMLAEAVTAALYAGDQAAMRAAGERIAAIADRLTSPRARFFASMAQGQSLTVTGGGEEGAALIGSAAEMALSMDELLDDPRLLVWAAMGPIWLRDATGRSLLDRVFERARAHAAVGVLPLLLGHLAVDQSVTNQWARAEANFYEAIELARETDQTADLTMLLARLAWMEARQGKEDRCREHAAEALQLSGDHGIVLPETWAQAAIGDLEFALGNASAALASFEARASLLETHGIVDPDQSANPELVEVHLRLGQPEVAAAMAEVAFQEATRKGQPWALARAERCRGLVAGDDNLDGPFKQALAYHEMTPDVFEMARTRLVYGARMRRARRRLDARQQLRLAIDDFDRLGAGVWAEAARTELAATGETARRRTPDSINQLTPQEMQIATLLAGGRTTREAAAAVFLSPKTVEYHLRSVYRKLGINSRTELAAAIGSEDAFSSGEPSSG